MPAIALQDKSSRLARPLARGLNLRLSREAKQPNHPVREKLMFHIPFSSHYIQTLKPTKCRELLERKLREKPQRKTRLPHPQSLLRDSSNSSTLFLSIDTSLRGSLPNPFLTIPISMKRFIWCFGKQLGRNQYTLVDAMVWQRNLGN